MVLSLGRSPPSSGGNRVLGLSARLRNEVENWEAEMERQNGLLEKPEREREDEESRRSDDAAPLAASAMDRLFCT